MVACGQYFGGLRLARFAWASLMAASLSISLSAHAADIVVDTGHTPQHPGATAANGVVEYQYNLRMTTVLSRDLAAAGYQVHRVAADGREIALTERATQAPEAKLFISIHHDSMPQEWIDAGRNRELAGFAIFVSQKNPFFTQSMQCARQIGEKLVAIGEKPSLYHATPIAEENRPLLDAALGVHQFDDLVVLKTAPMTAVLVEIGVIVNPNEAERLCQDKVIERIALSIATGIRACQPR